MACKRVVFKRGNDKELDYLVTEIFVELNRGCSEIEVQGIDRGINSMVEALSILKEKLGGALRIVKVETSSIRTGSSGWRRLLRVVIKTA
ncbi:MAG: hypothetical protein F7C07_05565 [Desulfurococcales archaeon]|nr:hypothetical protein [Desulfurococcales archaeon]